MIVGLLHPGEMGACVGAALAAAGHDVVWASEGRSKATCVRARSFRDVGSLEALTAGAEVVFSVVPPHAALELAWSLPRFEGIYVDANAVSPASTYELQAAVQRFVDGGIIGNPPAPRLYLSGEEAAAAASLFDGSVIAAEVVANASALKCAYAAWTKGTAALLLAIRDFARAEGVEDALVTEWARSQPQLPERLRAAERSAAAKGWRWVGEMEEIAAAFEADGLPGGFHEAAARVFGKNDGPSTV